MIYLVFLKQILIIMIFIESKRKKHENILKKHPDAIIADVTSHAKDSLIKFQNDTMKNIKRTIRKYGKPLGHL